MRKSFQNSAFFLNFETKILCINLKIRYNINKTQFDYELFTI